MRSTSSDMKNGRRLSVFSPALLMAGLLLSSLSMSGRDTDTECGAICHAAESNIPANTQFNTQAEAQQNSIRFKQAVNFYKQGQFARAIELLQTVLLSEPTNAQAHYYYGNCLARDGQFSAANFEYRAGYKYAPAQSSLRSYCLSGINNTTGQKTATAAEAKARVAAVDGADSAVSETKATESKGVAENQATNSSSKHLDQHFSQVQAEVEQERLAKVAAKQKELDNAIARMQAQMREDIYQVPKYMLTDQAANLDYNNAVQRIRTSAEEKIKIKKIDFEEEFRKINDFYAAKLQVLLSSHTNLKKQISATSGSSQVVPSNTNMYLRNYVNYGGTDEAPLLLPAGEALQAVPEKLKNRGKGGADTRPNNPRK